MDNDASAHATDSHAIQDLVTLLLHGALQASQALDHLQRLAAHPANTDPAALNEVNDAIATMSRVRSALIHDANHLAAGLPRA